MKQPEKFETVLQPPKSRVCGAAVCAMALGKTLEQVVAEVDYRDLCHPAGIARYLARHGVTMGLWFDGADPADGPAQFTLDPAGRPAIVAVESHNYVGADHWTFWDGEQYRDPTGQTGLRYEVLEVWFLAYHDEPGWVYDAPEDWRAPHNYAPRCKESMSL